MWKSRRSCALLSSAGVRREAGIRKCSPTQRRESHKRDGRLQFMLIKPLGFGIICEEGKVSLNYFGACLSSVSSENACREPTLTRSDCFVDVIRYENEALRHVIATT
jgi:hypothetical protein